MLTQISSLRQIVNRHKCGIITKLDDKSLLSSVLKLEKSKQKLNLIQ